ncbi:lipopolysaccharide biosynthesis protein [Jutongia sp.]
MIKKSGFFQNIMYAFGAQGISMVLSLLMSLFLPKVLGVKEYSYWQLFVFYISYAGFFHLGENDGMYLKQGGKNYDELDYSLLNTNLFLITCFQTITMIVGCIMLWIIDIADANRIFVLICAMIYMIIYNYSGYLSYILQISNRIREYSISVVIEKVLFLIAVIAGIITNKALFMIYIILNLVAKVISLLYTIAKCQEVVVAKISFSKDAFIDFWDNIKVGINLTFSSVAGMLVLGVGRNLIDARWGVETFGKFSLAISLSNFMLQFISQISLVLFPALKRADENKVINYYHIIQDLLSFVTLGVFLGYMPLYYLLCMWLPQYNESLRYMVILLPICVFDGKMNLLCNTYLKVLRKEKQLLYFNLVALFVSFCICSFGAYVLKSVLAVAIFMVIAVAIRSIISEIYLNNVFHIGFPVDFIIDSTLSLIFIIGTWFTGAIKGFVLYFFAYVIVCILFRKRIKEILEEIR